MISVIVCSRSAELFNAFAENVVATIGVEHEVIRIDNSNNQYSICSAYNFGAAKASFDILCFVHEDVLFKTDSWGKNLLAHFNSDTDIGLIGIAGSVYKSKMSTAWWQSEAGWPEITRMNLVQHSKSYTHPKALYSNPHNDIRSEVVALDGVLLVTDKSTWLQYPFDEKLLKGFHGYDLDFSMQVRQTKKVVVVYDVLLDHFSGGNSNGVWLSEILKVHKKWKQHLPAVAHCKVTDNVYSNGLKRLRKHMNLLVSEERSWLYLLRKSYQFFSFLDEVPSATTLAKDYLKEVYRFTKMKFANPRKHKPAAAELT